MTNDDQDKPVSSIGDRDMTPEQLALIDSERVTATTRYGPLVGGRVRNGVQVFLDVPYAMDVPRWSDPQPLTSGYRYAQKEYVRDNLYACPPDVRYHPESDQRDKVGLGRPTESPFFANIFVPSSFRLGTHPSTLPVKVFIHGGFLQVGSANNFCQNQQFFAAEHNNEVRVLLGYRLGVLGFLASNAPQLDGNWGFKDIWLGLEWVKENISAFGGDPSNVHLTGQSAGGHLIHNLLHRYAKRAPEQAPFVTATLYSNALFEDPLSLEEHQDQFDALCQQVGLDPKSPNVLEQLRDRETLPMETLFKAIREMDKKNSFNPASGDWLGEGMIAYQQSGDMARDLLKAGVKCIVLGDVRDEDAEYKDTHDCHSERDVIENLYRWNRRPIIDAFYPTYPPLPKTAGREEFQQRLGDCLADIRVRLPIRLFVRDLIRGGMPVVRYTIEQVARHLNTNGLVPHSSDLVIHFYRLSVLVPKERDSALAFNTELFASVAAAVRQDGTFVQRGPDVVLALEPNGLVQWREDWRLARVQPLISILRP